MKTQKSMRFKCTSILSNHWAASRTLRLLTATDHSLGQLSLSYFLCFFLNKLKPTFKVARYTNCCLITVWRPWWWRPDVVHNCCTIEHWVHQYWVLTNRCRPQQSNSEFLNNGCWRTDVVHNSCTIERWVPQYRVTSVPQYWVTKVPQYWVFVRFATAVWY